MGRVKALATQKRAELARFAAAIGLFEDPPLVLRGEPAADGLLGDLRIGRRRAAIDGLRRGTGSGRRVGGGRNSARPTPVLSCQELPVLPISTPLLAL